MAMKRIVCRLYFLQKYIDTGKIWKMLGTNSENLGSIFRMKSIACYDIAIIEPALPLRIVDIVWQATVFQLIFTIGLDK